MYETSGGEESWCAHLFHSSLLFFPQRCMLLVNVHFKAFCAFNQHVGDSQPASPRDLLAAPPDSVGSSPRHILPVPSPSQGRPGRAGAGLPPEGPRPPETQTAGLGQGQTSARGGGGGVRPDGTAAGTVREGGQLSPPPQGGHVSRHSGAACTEPRLPERQPGHQTPTRPPPPAGPALAAARSLPQPVRNGPANDRRGRSSEES